MTTSISSLPAVRQERPKGATLSHRNILNNAYLSAREVCALRLKTNSVFRFPLYHCFGMVLGNAALRECWRDHGLLRARCLTRNRHLLNGFRGKLYGACTACRPCLSPSLICRISRTLTSATLRTGIIAGSTCPVELMNRMIKDMELTEIVIGYGQTECSPINTMTAIDETVLNNGFQQ